MGLGQEQGRDRSSGHRCWVLQEHVAGQDPGEDVAKGGSPRAARRGQGGGGGGAPRALAPSLSAARACPPTAATATASPPAATAACGDLGGLIFCRLGGGFDGPSGRSTRTLAAAAVASAAAAAAAAPSASARRSAGCLLVLLARSSGALGRHRRRRRHFSRVTPATSAQPRPYRAICGYHVLWQRGLAVQLLQQPLELGLLVHRPWRFWHADRLWCAGLGASIGGFARHRAVASPVGAS